MLLSWPYTDSLGDLEMVCCFLGFHEIVAKVSKYLMVDNFVTRQKQSNPFVYNLRYQFCFTPSYRTSRVLLYSIHPFIPNAAFTRALFN